MNYKKLKDTWTSPLSIIENYTKYRCLAVTGYWELGNKSRISSSHEKYMSSFSRTLNFNVDYCASGSIDFLNICKKFREGKKTYTNEISWDTLVERCEKYFGIPNILSTIGNASLHRDTARGEFHCPSEDLLLIWISKILLVEETLKKYPEYTHYGWIDAGYKGTTDKYPSQEEWPASAHDLENVKGMYVKNTDNACHPQYWERTYQEGCPIGGMWFGDKNSIKEFVEISKNIVMERLHNNKTVCTEQDVFQHAIEKMDNVYKINNVNYEPFWFKHFSNPNL